MKNELTALSVDKVTAGDVVLYVHRHMGKFLRARPVKIKRISKVRGIVTLENGIRFDRNGERILKDLYCMIHDTIYMMDEKAEKFLEKKIRNV